MSCSLGLLDTFAWEHWLIRFNIRISYLTYKRLCMPTFEWNRKDQRNIIIFFVLFCFSTCFLLMFLVQIPQTNKKWPKIYLAKRKCTFGRWGSPSWVAIQSSTNLPYTALWLRSKASVPEHFSFPSFDEFGSKEGFSISTCSLKDHDGQIIHHLSQLRNRGVNGYMRGRRLP